MTLKDFFHLSEEAFATRLSHLSNEDLMKDDIHNCRTIYSGAYCATIGALQAVPTAGISLVSSAIGLRRRNVAKRRLEMVHEEIRKRGLPIHQETKRDRLIPLGISGVSFGLSGVAEGLMQAVPVESLVDAGVDLGTSVVAQMGQEVGGKVVVEGGAVGSEVVMERATGVGRKKVCREKLVVSRSASSLPMLVVPEQSSLGVEARSAPQSPLLEPGTPWVEECWYLGGGEAPELRSIPAVHLTETEVPPALSPRPR